MARISNDGETPLGKRLVAVRKAFEYEERKPFAVELGISEGKLGRYEQGQSQPGADVLAIFRDKFDVDLNWLATGEGQMHTEKETIRQNKSLQVLDVFSYIPRYDVRVSAGNGMLVVSEEVIGQMAFDQRWLNEIGLDPEQAGVVVASGDSMYPTIANGTPMVVDFTDARPQNGRIYVINVGGEVLVKRLERTIDDKLILISDNPHYERRTISLTDFSDMKIIGAVRYILKGM
ncbi:MAG: XRE family transcriptional regulator [Rhizobiaceae bacterium]